MESGSTHVGEERTIVGRPLVERIVSALLDDDASVRYGVVAEIIDAVPQWWTGGPVLPHVRRPPGVE